MPQTERLGLAALEYFFAQHGWLFREQPTQDYGIDAHAEIVADERPTGKLLALQIKSGNSFFKEKSGSNYVFRTDDIHISYWIGHSMPVILALYNPETKQACFQHVSQQTVTSTGKNWKILVPDGDVLTAPERTLQWLDSLTQPEPYIRRLNRLRVDRHWMDRLAKGYEVRITFDKWINKSLPRYKIAISSEENTEIWPTLFAPPGIGVEGMLEHFFPWADFSVDEVTHVASAEEQWEVEYVLWRDPETGQRGYSKSFEEWYRPPRGIEPVSRDGEIESYSLILMLNEVGEAFLELDDFLAQ
ncbi:DUF4365 domain-containing protein [Nitrosomonas sp. HPC101]|uniref:DUF4365 domain-containing protein n=1 Tax=Nitrosomonas sp. HPC101 TaxID=1658667 RepID=UPI00136D910E|nr:DUF4365 domain-containing protein [Nitrosomonas sp. HPC101]MXS85532.1 DUF4365 domain-containing protein [Nitrosomonas sp. HPC101]